MTVISKEQVAVFPAVSVKVYVTVVEPIRKKDPGLPVRATVGSCPSLSVAVGSVQVTVAPFTLDSLAMTMLSGQPAMTG